MTLLLLAVVAAHSSAVTVATVVEAIIAIIGFLALIVGAAKYLGSASVKAQLSAKDDVIKTHEQTIGAFESRMDSLESQVSDLQFGREESKQRIGQLEAEVIEWKAKYSALEAYASPKAVERFEAHLIAMDTKLAQLLKDPAS